MNRDAVDRFQQRQLDKILLLDEAANRQRRRHHDQGIADLGIDEPVHSPRIGQRHGYLGMCGIGDASGHDQGFGRRLHRIRESESPIRDAVFSAARERRHLRTAEPNAHRLAPVQWQQVGVCYNGAVAAADRRKIERRRGVKHQPDRVGPAKQRRRRGGRKGKRQVQALAVAFGPNRDGVVAGSCIGRRLRCRQDLGRRLHRNPRRFADRRRWLRRCRFTCLRCRRRLRCRLRFDGNFRRPGQLLRRRRSFAGLLRRRHFPVGLLGRGRRGDRWHGFRWSSRFWRSRGRGSGGRDGGRRHGCSGGAQRCRGRRLRRGFARLLERDIDDVVLVLAEGMDIDIADQFDFDGGGFAVYLLIDRCDIRRRRHLGVGEIETEHGIELQREFLVVEHGRNVDPARHLEHEANEGRLDRCTNANGRTLLRGRCGALQTQCAFGGARAFSQFADHIGGKARRRTGPAIRQQINEYPFAGRHGVDRHPARQRKPDRRTIGIAPRRSDIVGHGVGQLVDRNIHGLLEADHDDRAGRGHLGLDIVGEFEHQPGVPAGRGERGLALDRIRPAGSASPNQQQRRRKPARAKQPTPDRPRIRANSRPKSSGNRSRHCSMGLSARRSDRQRDALARLGKSRIGKLRTC